MRAIYLISALLIIACSELATAGPVGAYKCTREINKIRSIEKKIAAWDFSRSQPTQASDVREIINRVETDKSELLSLQGELMSQSSTCESVCSEINDKDIDGETVASACSSRAGLAIFNEQLARVESYIARLESMEESILRARSLSTDD